MWEAQWLRTDSQHLPNSASGNRAVSFESRPSRSEMRAVRCDRGGACSDAAWRLNHAKSGAKLVLASVVCSKLGMSLPLVRSHSSWLWSAHSGASYWKPCPHAFR